VKTTRRESFHVVVEPKTHGYGVKLYNENEVCEQIVEQVSRHCDNVYSARVVCEREYACSFCGGPWTEDDGQCNECCDREIEEFEARRFARKDVK
jgi:hypothetical protein